MRLCENAGSNAHIFKAAIAQISKQERACVKARCQQILPAVPVVVSPTKRYPSSPLCEARQLADFAKFPVSFVVKQPDAVTAFGIDDSRRHGEIDSPVIIVIRPRGAESIYGAAEACAFGYIGESCAAFIVKE